MSRGILHKHSISANFTIVPNDILNSGMSALAVAILIHYLSKPDGWYVSNDYIRDEVYPEYGVQRIAEAVNELIERGYYSRQRHHGDAGQWVWVMHISDQPEYLGDVAEPELQVAKTTGSRETVSRSGRTPCARKRSGHTYVVPRKGEQEKVSYESSDDELGGQNDQPKHPHQDQPNLVAPPRQSRRKPSKPRRVAVAEESPADTGAVVGMSTATSAVKFRRAEKQAVGNPNSGGGLAREFGQRVADTGMSGPQQVNGPGLAKNLTAWMRDGTNPDTPDRIRSMFDQFFASPLGESDRPLWRRFLSEAPKLRHTERKAQPVDYKAATANNEQWLLERAAVVDDKRGGMAISGEKKPWMNKITPANS